MAAAIGLREDYDAGALRALAKRAKDGPQARRLLALASIYDGAARSGAAENGGVGTPGHPRLGYALQRPWSRRTRRPQGARTTPKLNDAHRAALMKMIEEGPTPAIHGVVRWQIVDLCQWVFEEFRIAVAEQTMSRELRKMGLRKLSARPRHHAQAEGAIENFKKVSRPAWTKSRAKKVSHPTR